MSGATILRSISLAALLSLGACDKGPKAGDPSPAASKTAAASNDTAAKTAETAPAVSGKTYGAGVGGEAEVLSIAQISANPEAYEGKTVRVEGMVTDVCVKRGCWIELAGQAPGEKIRFKVTDGEMVFPVDSKGQRAVTQGKLVTRKMTVEELRAQAEHFAKESGKEFDPSTITEPKVSFRIQGTGAVIADK